MKPKEAFLQKTDVAAQFRKMSESIPFEEASNAAMLEFVARIPEQAAEAEAAANNYRLEGARQFLKILTSIAERPKTTERAPLTENLDHKA